MVNIFITGATGYIGGDILYALKQKYPDYNITALVRTAEKEKLVKDSYPDVRVVQGDNDSSDLLEKEAAAADIVIHTADSSDHIGAAKAIAKGLAQHSKEKPGYWLHTGGTGILTYFDSSANKTGVSSDKIFDDWENVSELLNLPHEAFHRDVDEVVLEAGTKNKEVVKTALVCPPTIYGVGRGPSLTRGRQVYELAKCTLERGKGPVLGEGKARWNNVHVHDLADAYVLLVEAAVQGKANEGLWGEKAYYFTENGEHYWGLLAEWVAKAAADMGFIAENKTEEMNEEKAKDVAGFESLSWGWNSRGSGQRLRELLGWEPKMGPLTEEVPAIVRAEAARLGMEGATHFGLDTQKK